MNLLSFRTTSIVTTSQSNIVPYTIVWYHNQIYPKLLYGVYQESEGNVHKSNEKVNLLSFWTTSIVVTGQSNVVPYTIVWYHNQIYPKLLYGVYQDSEGNVHKSNEKVNLLSFWTTSIVVTGQSNVVPYTIVWYHNQIYPKLLYGVYQDSEGNVHKSNEKVNLLSFWTTSIVVTGQSNVVPYTIVWYHNQIYPKLLYGVYQDSEGNVHKSNEKVNLLSFWTTSIVVTGQSNVVPYTIVWYHNQIYPNLSKIAHFFN